MKTKIMKKENPSAGKQKVSNRISPVFLVVFLIFAVVLFLPEVNALSQNSIEGWWKDDFTDTSGIATSSNILMSSKENWTIETISHFIPHDVIVVDVDDDGDLDIITNNYHTAVVWLENGNNWKVHIISDTFNFLHDSQIGDIDGDGRWDVISCDLSHNDSYYSGNSVVKWYQRPADTTGTWTETVITSFVDLPGARQLAIDDLDKDGDNDIVVAIDNSGVLAWLENPGGADSFNGSKWNNYTLDTSVGGNKYVKIKDIDKDGNKDIIATITSKKGVFVYFAPENPTNISGWIKVKINSDVDTYKSHGLEVVDIDEDGDEDIIVNGPGVDNNAVTWFENPYPTAVRDGNWSNHTIRANTATRSFMKGIQAVDLDEDGDLDVITAQCINNSAGEIYWHENPGDPKGSWTSHLLNNGSHYLAWTHEIAHGDMDGDGHQDIIALNTGGYTISILKNRLFGVTGEVKKWKAWEEMDTHLLSGYGSGSSMTYRILIHSTHIPISGNKIRIRFSAVDPPTSYSGFNITKAYIAEVDPNDERDIIDSTKTNITFNNGQDSTGLIPPGEFIWSDIIDFDFNQSKNYSVTFHSYPSSFGKFSGNIIGRYYRYGNHIDDLDWSDNDPHNSTSIVGLYSIGIINSSNIISTEITPLQNSLDKWSWSRFYVSDFGNITYNILDKNNNTIISDVSNGQDISSITDSTIKLQANFTSESVYEAPKIFWWGIVLGGIYEGNITNTVYSNGTYDYNTPPFGYSHVNLYITPSQNSINITIDTHFRNLLQKMDRIRYWNSLS